MTTETTARLMQGDEACAEGAIAAGCRFFAGYPITPATEIAEVLSRRLPQVGGKFIQMEDEIGSIAAISVSGPSFRLTEERLVELAEATREAAQAVSHQLGWSGEDNPLLIHRMFERR